MTTFRQNAKRPGATGRGFRSNRLNYASEATTKRLPANWRERIARIDPLAFWQLHLPGQPLRPNPTGWCAVKCPWHADSAPSASVNVAHGGFRCHACGLHLDLIGACWRFHGGQFGAAIADLLGGRHG